jgi:hypothetical protein
MCRFNKMFSDVLIFFSKIFKLKDVLVQLGLNLEWFGCGSKHCCIMVHVSFSWSRSKSLSFWPFGSSIHGSFVKYNENKDLIALIPNASIWKFGMKFQSKHVFPHLLQIISFISHICVHARNNNSHNLCLIVDMQKSTLQSFFFQELIFDGGGCPHVKLLSKHILEWCWMITMAC